MLGRFGPLYSRLSLGGSVRRVRKTVLSKPVSERLLDNVLARGRRPLCQSLAKRRLSEALIGLAVKASRNIFQDHLVGFG